MSRLGVTPPGDLQGDKKEFYNEMSNIANKSFHSSKFNHQQEDGALIGPFGVFLTTPELGRGAFALSQALGKLAKGNLSPIAREVAILTTGSKFQAAYELYAHTAIGLEHGLSEIQINQIKQGRKPDGLAEDAAVCYDVASELVNSSGPMSEATWTKADGILGRTGVTALIHYVSFYSYISVMMNGFDITVPKDGT